MRPKPRNPNLALIHSKTGKARKFIHPIGKGWQLFVRTVHGAYSRRLVSKRAKKESRKLASKFKRTYMRLLLRQSKNNFFSTLLTKNRRVLWSLSCGIIGMLGPRRSTPFGAEQLGRHTAIKLTRTKVRRAHLVLKSPFNTHVRGFIKYLLAGAFTAKAIVDLIPRPHNGMRSRKKRRI